LSEFEAKQSASETEPASTAKSSRVGEEQDLHQKGTHQKAASEKAGDVGAEAIHDFAGKLKQPSLRPKVVDYLPWQRALRKARKEGSAAPEMPDLVPLSINLDLTTACNYACDHCIDWDILNKPFKHEDQELWDSMREMAERGMRSVILIGGGEPTLYPKFKEFVAFLKELKLQVAVVSNGSRNDKILEIAPMLEKGDWVRLSLDSGSNDVFQRMHNPSKKNLTLDEICAWVPKIKKVNPAFDFGFSYVITWHGATRDDTRVVENIQEMVMASKRARDAGFNYISFKPFLERADTGSEVMDPAHMEGELAKVVARIQAQVAEAKTLEQPGFRVVESINLRMLIDGNWRDFTKQPRMCHMQALRQVLNPHGTYNCPAYRGVTYARIGEKDAYKDPATVRKSSTITANLLDNFDASDNCKEVTCLYNGTNWWLEEVIEGDGDIDSLMASAERRDWFL
jgi:sulfatase maturation enzyme AslB (radical SAM superfamily)